MPIKDKTNRGIYVIILLLGVLGFVLVGYLMGWYNVEDIISRIKGFFTTIIDLFKTLIGR